MGNDNNKETTIIKEEHIRKIFNAYSSIKDFLIKYIYGKENISIDNGIEVYLVSTKSIPNFIRLLKEQYKIEIKDESELLKMEEKLRDKFKKYVIEKDIVIYNSFQDCSKIINDEENNEFIIVDETFFKNLNINEGKYRNKEVKINEINKEEKSIKILFPVSEKMIGAKEKQKGYFQFCEIIENSITVEPNIIYQSIITIQRKNESSMLDNDIENQNIFMNNSSLIRSIVYCLLNIKSFYDYFINNEINETDKFSIIFHSIANQKKNKNYNFDITDLIKVINNYNINSPKNIMEIIYNNIHLELKENKENILTKIMTQDKDDPDPVIEVCNTCNKFEKMGKSIVSDIFYFQDLITNQSQNTGKILNYKSSMRNNIIFPLKEIIKFKNNSSELNIFDCFDYLTSKKIAINDDGYYYNKNNSVNSIYSINSTKEILTIYLDREDDFKNEINFILDFDIDLSKYFFNKEIKHNFELIGFCSFYKDKKICFPFYKNYEDNIWYYYDGLSIKIYSNNLSIGAPFLLFYKVIPNKI